MHYFTSYGGHTVDALKALNATASLLATQPAITTSLTEFMAQRAAVMAMQQENAVHSTAQLQL